MCSHMLLQQSIASIGTPILASLGGLFLGGAFVAYVQGQDVSRMWEGTTVEMLIQLLVAGLGAWLALQVV